MMNEVSITDGCFASDSLREYVTDLAHEIAYETRL
jgi:hypothetical protein